MPYGRASFLIKRIFMFKNNFKDYSIRLTVKACIYYEQLTGKSFFVFGHPGTTEEDVLKLIYSCFIASNDVTMTFSTFTVLYGDDKFSKWLEGEFEDAMLMNQQFNRDIAVDDNAEDQDDSQGEEVRKATVTSVAASLIANNHMSAEYVMNQMQLFEMQHYLKAIDAADKARLIEQRLWTYLTIAPHIDTKKIKSPQKLLPFEWEESEIRKRELDELRENKDTVKKMVGMDMSALFRRQGDDSGPELQSLDIKGSDLAITDEEQHGDD